MERLNKVPQGGNDATTASLLQWCALVDLQRSQVAKLQGAGWLELAHSEAAYYLQDILSLPHLAICHAVIYRETGPRSCLELGGGIQFNFVRSDELGSQHVAMRVPAYRVSDARVREVEPFTAAAAEVTAKCVDELMAFAGVEGLHLRPDLTSIHDPNQEQPTVFYPHDL